jgi:hypothetical protein
MERAEILRDLAARGADTDPARCAELAARLGMLVSDLLVITGIRFRRIWFPRSVMPGS